MIKRLVPTCGVKELRMLCVVEDLRLGTDVLRGVVSEHLTKVIECRQSLRLP